MGRIVPILAVLGLTLLASMSALAVPAGAGAARGAEVVPDQYIVVFKPSVADAARETHARERAGGFRSRHRYSRALKGFAARLSPAQVRNLRRDADVAFVSPDRVVRTAGWVPLAAGEPTPPTGVRRMQAAGTTVVREPSSANVAVIDTGIDLSHPDLAASDGRNCVGTGTAQDDHGHGTHVAGSIGARNDGAGVVGVSPGTRMYAVKVLNAEGSGTTSQVVCGIDWVTANAAALNIKVANMSLGGIGPPVGSCATTTDPEHKAICNSTAAGVSYVVAAGNDAWDFDYAPEPDIPAAYPEVLTVTAASDSDGLPGGAGGSPACRSTEGDDRRASFSNFAATAGGSDHTIAAPGVCIRSTWPGGGHRTISGTSMAAPHVAGSVALCLGEGSSPGPCAGLSPAQIVQRMRSAAADHTLAAPGYGFVGDPGQPVADGYFGHLDWSGPVAGEPTITISPTSLPSGMVGRAYSQTLAGAGGTAPYAFAVTSGSLPAGVTLDSAGQLAGTPQGTGTWSFTVRATDADGFGGSRAYSLSVAQIELGPASLPAGEAGTAYGPVAFTASGGSEPYSFSVSSGALPPGLTLASTGSLSGTPTGTGTFDFTIRAADGTGAFVARPYTVSVSGPASGTADGGGTGESAPPESGEAATTDGGASTVISAPLAPISIDAARPQVSVLRLAASTFRAARRGPSARTAAAGLGTRVSWRLSERARVVFAVQRALTGRRAGRRCVRTTAANRGRRPCTRYVTLRGRFVRTGLAGANAMRFMGRIGGRTLAPGRHRLVATATDSAGNRSLVRRIAFRIVR